MTERERLVSLFEEWERERTLEILATGKVVERSEYFADRVMGVGGVVPPCKVGDMVYMPWEWNGSKGIACLKVLAFHNVLGVGWYYGTDFEIDDECYAEKYNCGRFGFDDIGKTVFLTIEDARREVGG